jgi:uncharacterized protein
MSKPSTVGPVAGSERIESIDVLRGFALLGILVMNIQAFSMISAAYMNPTAYGDLSGANLWVWALGRVFADQKFMTIFSALFGAGIVLMWQRMEAAGQPATALHYRRTVWLMVFGAVHAYLVWYGDILFIYGLCGLWVYWLRRLTPRRLAMVGIAVLLVAPLLFALSAISMPTWPPEALADFSSSWRPDAETVSVELANMRGGWSQQMRTRIPLTLSFHTGGLIFYSFWRVSGLMLIGMALFKVGFFSAERSDRLYGRLVLLAVCVGFPLVAFGMQRDFANDWALSRFFVGTTYNYLGSLPVSLGYASVIMLICRHGGFRGLQTGLAAVGRMALTNYLMQTIICTTIFYGHGFGYFGSVDRVGQIVVVVAVWAFQVPFSVWWLRRFRFGPFEWLWRSLSYMRLQPLRGS